MTTAAAERVIWCAARGQRGPAGVRTGEVRATIKVLPGPHRTRVIDLRAYEQDETGSLRPTSRGIVVKIGRELETLLRSLHVVSMEPT